MFTAAPAAPEVAAASAAATPAVNTHNKLEGPSADTVSFSSAPVAGTSSSIADIVSRVAQQDFVSTIDSLENQDVANRLMLGFGFDGIA